MPKDESKRNRFGLFGLDPTLGLGDKVLDHVEEAQDKERERLRKSDYYAFCPNCGRKQIKANLVENGCFVCGWEGTEEDIELAKAKLQSGKGRAKQAKDLGYKTNCPDCGASVITEEFFEKGCWLCGYKEQKEVKNGGTEGNPGFCDAQESRVVAARGKNPSGDRHVLQAGGGFP